MGKSETIVSYSHSGEPIETMPFTPIEEAVLELTQITSAGPDNSMEAEHFSILLELQG